MKLSPDSICLPSQKQPWITQEKVTNAVDGTRNLGKTLAMSWSEWGDKLDKVSGKIGLGDRLHEGIDNGRVRLGYGLGYGVVGLQGISGIAKLVQGCRTGKAVHFVDAGLDLSAAAAIASVMLGATGPAIALGGLAAGLGVTRGVQLGVQAFRSGEPLREVQAFRETCQAGVVATTILKSSVPALGVVGAILGPVAAAIQLCQGYVQVREGLKTKDKELQMVGLTGVATGVGLAISVAGLPAVGLAVVGGAHALRWTAKLVPPAARKAGQLLDKHAPSLKRVAERVEKAIDPAFKKIRDFIAEHTPFHHGDLKPNTPAQEPEQSKPDKPDPMQASPPIAA